MEVIIFNGEVSDLKIVHFAYDFPFSLITQLYCNKRKKKRKVGLNTKTSEYLHPL